MATITLNYNDKNSSLQKAIDFITSLKGIKVMTGSEEGQPPKIRRKGYDGRQRTLKAINDAKRGKDMTSCDTFEEYLKAVCYEKD